MTEVFFAKNTYTGAASPAGPGSTTVDVALDWLVERTFVTPADSAATLIAALGFSREVVVDGVSSITLTTSAQVQTFVEKLNRVSPTSPTDFILPAGDHGMLAQVELTNPHMRNVNIVGDIRTQVDCTAVANSGSAKDYAITYTLSDASDVAVGDYLYVGYTAGTGDHPVAEGVWKVTGVSGSDVTVKHTYHGASWPTMTVTAARVVPLKTILRWPVTQRGIAVAGTSLRSMRNLVLASEFNITTGTPVDSYSDGLQVGSAADKLNTGSSESQQTNSGAMWLWNVGLVEWEGNGAQCVGGNVYFFQAAFCANGWRGCQVARSGSAGVKACIANGNGSSGFQGEANGYLGANDGVACGNGEQGVYGIGPASVSFIDGFAIGNLTTGLDFRNFATGLADGATVKDNGTFNLLSQGGEILFGAGATASGGGTRDVECIEGGIVNGNGGSSLGTVNVDTDSGARVIDTDGELIYPVNVTLLENNGHTCSLAQSTVGTVLLQVDGTNRLVIRTSGLVYPVGDNTQALGRSTERFAQGYIFELRPGDGTAIWRTGAGTPEGNITAVVGSLYTRTDGGAGTTFYVKESGTGNTGWVAK